MSESRRRSERDSVRCAAIAERARARPSDSPADARHSAALGDSALRELDGRWLLWAARMNSER